LNDENLKTLADRLAGNFAEDIIQEVAIEICSKTDAECEKLSGYFNFWCSRMIMNMSGKRGLIRNYKKRNEVQLLTEIIADSGKEYDHEIDEAYYRTMEIIDGLHWYDRELFLLYRQEGSFRNVEKRVGINYQSVYNTVKKVKKHIKEQLC